MKKLFVFICMVMFITGCGKGEEVKCTIDGKEAIFTLKNGVINSYKLDNKKISKSEIDEINGTYFTSSQNNDDAMNILEDYVDELGGSCDEE